MTIAYTAYTHGEWEGNDDYLDEYPKPLGDWIAQQPVRHAARTLVSQPFYEVELQCEFDPATGEHRLVGVNGTALAVPIVL